MSRLTTGATATLPNPSKVDSLAYLGRKAEQVTLTGLYFSYSYLNPIAASNGLITVTNNTLVDKYVNGVWQNPYFQLRH